jgi:hypothetical protein
LDGGLECDPDGEYPQRDAEADQRGHQTHESHVSPVREGRVAAGDWRRTRAPAGPPHSVRTPAQTLTLSCFALHEHRWHPQVRQEAFILTKSDIAKLENGRKLLDTLIQMLRLLNYVQQAKWVVPLQN